MFHRAAALSRVRNLDILAWTSQSNQPNS